MKKNPIKWESLEKQKIEAITRLELIIQDKALALFLLVLIYNYYLHELLSQLFTCVATSMLYILNCKDNSQVADFEDMI